MATQHTGNEQCSEGRQRNQEMSRNHRAEHGQSRTRQNMHGIMPLHLSSSLPVVASVGLKISKLPNLRNVGATRITIEQRSCCGLPL